MKKEKKEKKSKHEKTKIIMKAIDSLPPKICDVRCTNSTYSAISPNVVFSICAFTILAEVIESLCTNRA